MKFLSLFLLAGCISYKPGLPETNIPTAWKETISTSQTFNEKNRFWELFEDPILNTIEEEGISGNFNLQIAASRILEARALVKKDSAKRIPKADLNMSVSQNETLVNPRSFGSPTNHLERVNQEQYDAIADLSYEVDLWGKLKAKEKSAKYRYQSSEWEYEFVYQTLVTDIAIHYLLLRTYEEQIAFLKQAIEVWKDQVHLSQVRLEAGLENEIHLSKARLELLLVEGQLQQKKREFAIEENALAALVGKPASSWKVAPGNLPKKIPEIPSILPSEVLLRRADIQSAQHLVSAGRSDVNVALRNYFPSFLLTGSLGLSTPLLTHFFEWQARYWGYALNALEPLFDGGRRKADVTQAKALFNQAFATYQKTVNEAFKDVEDSLSTIRYKDLHIQAQTQAVAAASDTYAISEEQFNRGLISYLLVADSKNTLISVEKDLILLKGERLIEFVRLMKALGLQK